MLVDTRGPSRANENPTVDGSNCLPMSEARWAGNREQSLPSNALRQSKSRSPMEIVHLSSIERGLADSRLAPLSAGRLAAARTAYNVRCVGA